MKEEPVSLCCSQPGDRRDERSAHCGVLREQHLTSGHMFDFVKGCRIER